MSTRPPRTIRLAEDRWATVRHVVEAIAIVAAGLWGFYTFIYQERIKPSFEVPSLVQDVAIERLGRDARREILRLSIHMHNTGKAQLDVAADAYNVFGTRYGTKVRHVHAEIPGAERASNLVPVISERLIATFAELRESAAGGRPHFNVVIEPGAEYTFQYLLVVPRGAYDVVRAQAIAVPVKLPVERKAQVKIVHLADGASWLQASGGAFEDDSETQFALIP